MNPQLIIAVIIAAASFGTAWRIQDWRFNAKEKAHAEQKLAQVQLSAAASIRRADNVIEAQNQSAARSAALRRDLDGARTELDRLRLALARTVPRASATGDACAVPADPARELLATCATELVEMGGVADRHASDAQTLIEAWPK
jgi:hypothetical protein